MFLNDVLQNKTKPAHRMFLHERVIELPESEVDHWV